jgi:hypothetical protein
MAVATEDMIAEMVKAIVDEVDTWRNSINHIIARSLREGRVIYERFESL